VLVDRESRGVLGLGLLAERGEHAPHEAALVAPEVETGGPGDLPHRGGREEQGGGDDGAAKHRGSGVSDPELVLASASLPDGWLVRVCVWRLAAAAAPLCFAEGGLWPTWGKRASRWWGQVGVEETATRDPTRRLVCLHPGSA
jgi:hypothetical protein